MYIYIYIYIYAYIDRCVYIYIYIYIYPPEPPPAEPAGMLIIQLMIQLMILMIMSITITMIILIVIVVVVPAEPVGRRRSEDGVSWSQAAEGKRTLQQQDMCSRQKASSGFRGPFSPTLEALRYADRPIRHLGRRKSGRRRLTCTKEPAKGNGSDARFARRK